jgi:signal transduction histidine kinase
MKLYEFFSRTGLTRKSYALKFFLVALPLIIIAFAEVIIFSSMDAGTMGFPVVAIGVLILIAAAVFMLVMFRWLVSPLLVAREALEKYLTTNDLPNLPEDHDDAAGQLMGSIQATITKMNSLIIEKSDMIDLLSHDLRSPVGRILSLSELIKLDDDGSKDLYADYITSEGTGLLSLLENILMILKEDNNVFTLERVNLSKLVHETLNFSQFSISEKNLGLTAKIDEDIFIFVQRHLFTQAVRNILGNAIKFSPDGKVIHITGRQDEDQIFLSIKDEGLGLAATDIPKIFDRFTSAGKKGTRGESSTGLGLYLSKKIVERHGGQLVVESEGTNMGASFTIVLYKLITKKPQEKLVKRVGIKQVLAFKR